MTQEENYKNVDLDYNEIVYDEQYFSEEFIDQDFGTVVDIEDEKKYDSILTEISECSMKPVRTIIRGCVINEQEGNNNKMQV